MHKAFLATLAGTAVAVAAPALAQHGGGRGSAPTGSPTMATGQGSGGMGSMGSTMRDQSRSGSMGSTNASPTATTRANQNSPVSNGVTPPTTTTTGTRTRDQARSNSQGPANASPTGISHANENSVLATGSVPGTALPDIKTGLTVQTTGGTSIGTVSKVVTGTDGSIRQVVVTTQDGQTVTLMPNTLTISGGVVTTTSTSVGG